MPTENRSTITNIPPVIGETPLGGSYYAVECTHCGWVGSSEDITDDCQCTQPDGDHTCLGDTDEIGPDRLLGIVQAMAKQADGLRYKAELYDEVWALVTGLGYMNVTTAVSELRKDAEQNKRAMLALAATIGEICQALGIDDHSEPGMIVEAARELKELILRLQRIATREMRHVNNGACPDEIEGYAARDNDCPACQALMQSDELLEDPCFNPPPAD